MYVCTHWMTELKESNEYELLMFERLINEYGINLQKEAVIAGKELVESQ